MPPPPPPLLPSSGAPWLSEPGAQNYAPPPPPSSPPADYVTVQTLEPGGGETDARRKLEVSFVLVVVVVPSVASLALVGTCLQGELGRSILGLGSGVWDLGSEAQKVT